MSERKGTRKLYEIRTVEDFLSVPVEWRGVCIQEFAQWCAIHDLLAAANSAARETLGADLASCPRDVFKWIEDDKGEITFRIQTKRPEAAHD